MRRQICVALQPQLIQRITAQGRDGSGHILQSFRAALRRDDDFIECVARSSHACGLHGDKATQDDQYVTRLHSSPMIEHHVYCSKAFLRPTTRA